MGAGLPPRGGSLHPLAQSRGGGGRDGAWGGRKSTRRQATYEGGDVRRGGAGTRHRDGQGSGGGHTGGADNVRRAPEEKEARVFHPEVGDCFPSTVVLDRPGSKFPAFVYAGWRPPCLLSRLLRC
jgi:hypothetical protein